MTKFAVQLTSSIDYSDQRERALAHARTSRLETLKASISKLIRWMDAHRALSVLLLTLMVFATSMFMPSTAAAWPWDDFNPVQWINDAIAGAAVAMFQGAFGLLKGAADVDKIMGDFNGLLGASNSSFAAYSINIADSVLKTCAHTVLVIVILVQLIKIASQIDRNGGTLPAVRDVFQLFVFMGIFIFLVDNASTLMTGVFDLIQSITRAIDAELDAETIKKLELTVLVGAEFSDIAQGLLVLACGLIVYLIAFICSVITRCMAYARAITIYVLTMFSPMAFAFLGMDVTKQWGIGFLKNYIAEALSGCVMVVVLWFFPILFMSFFPDSMEVSFLDLPEIALDMVVSSLVLTLLIIRSGSIAQKILGGA